MLAKFLGNLSNILDKGVIHAEERKFDPANLLNDRLAPDMFPFIRQVQVATNTAVDTVFRLSGVPAPTFDREKEKTAEDLKKRLDASIAYLKSITPEQMEGSETRMAEIYFLKGKALPGLELLLELALPNFYFHMTAAYAILRHNGVPLGKGDYIGTLAYRDVPAN
jgi:uncharacterized protein